MSEICEFRRSVGRPCRKAVPPRRELKAFPEPTPTPPPSPRPAGHSPRCSPPFSVLCPLSHHPWPGPPSGPPAPPRRKWWRPREEEEPPRVRGRRRLGVAAGGRDVAKHSGLSREALLGRPRPCPGGPGPLMAALPAAPEGRGQPDPCAQGQPEQLLRGLFCHFPAYRWIFQVFG